MEKLMRWVAKNRYLALTLMSIAFGILLGNMMVWVELSTAAVWVIAVVFGFAAWFITNGCGHTLHNKAMKVMNERCDPYPFLEETKIQLAYRPDRQNELRLKINHAMALRNAGEYEQSWLILNGIHIDKYASTTPAMKAVYYNNLTDILTLLGRDEEAEVWYRKTVQIINDLPKGQKQKLAPARDLAIAEHFYRTGEYQTALERHAAVESVNALSRVEAAMFRARCAIAMEDRETARRELEYVIANGNRLHFVQTAREMMENL